MKLEIADGYVINPYIIWGELDYRGYAAIGLQPKSDFKDLKFLKEIDSRCQYLRTDNMDFLFMSCPLSKCSPNTSVFNLTDQSLNKFYQKTYENAQEEMFRSFFRIKNLSGQEVISLNEQDLFYLWAEHFNPLDIHLKEEYFNPSKTIMTNCLPECHLKESTLGFELNGCLHHYIQIKTCTDLSNLATKLKDYTFTISMSEHGPDTLIHITAGSLNEINHKSKELKVLLQSLDGVDYYEANNAEENVRFFERSVPGWCYGIKQETKSKVISA